LGVKGSVLDPESDLGVAEGAVDVDECFVSHASLLFYWLNCGPVCFSPNMAHSS